MSHINPDHYKDGHIQCIEYSRQMNFNIGNSYKYVWRCGNKEGNSVKQDLTKALWYCKDELKRSKTSTSIIASIKDFMFCSVKSSKLPPPVKRFNKLIMNNNGFWIANPRSDNTIYSSLSMNEIYDTNSLTLILELLWTCSLRSCKTERENLLNRAIIMLKLQLRQSVR